jgi:copper ion binding protein
MTLMAVEVGGMTCEHCTTAIERAVALVGGVEGVKADLASGRVEVMFSGPVDEPSVREAIEDEGYEVIAIGAAPA